MAGSGRRWGGLSLRLRLTLVTAGLVAVGLALGAVALTWVVSTSRIAALDEAAGERAATVSRLVADDRLPRSLPVTEPGEMTQVLDAAGRVVASSANASRTLPILDGPELAALREAGPVTSRTPYDERARVVAAAASWRGEPVTVVVALPLRDVEGVVRALRVSLIGVVPTLTLLLAGVIWFAVGRALRPVEELRSAAARVAVEGGPGALPVPSADDELGALARTLNEMLDRLDRAAARQRGFVEDAAHELRSPLSSLRASVEVAAAHPEAVSAADLSAELQPEVLRMQALVDDLLLLARVGAAPSARRQVDLAAVAAEVVAAVPSEVPVGLRGAGMAWGDAAALGRVVRNLVENAVRHASGAVRVTVAAGAVVVEDDGPGVPEGERERVFERFVRLDEARERGAGGTGLGLAIAREIARDHGGDVTLGESELGGLGARLSLPVHGDAAV
ncbi:ATP-binding protein [Tessaracoccus lapidicaptus]|uniref:ATP-binding protein n=1 Tax=Tessaracoccus lapidicaptus TaxID=1427523 RepID=UPI003342B92D